MKKQHKVAFETLGCKLNQAESEVLAREFVNAGFRLVDSVRTADVWVLNTCSVTHIADRKSRHMIRLARRQNPGALLVVTGCYVEREPADIAKIEDVNLLVDNKDKSRLVEIVCNVLGTSVSIKSSNSLGPGCDGFKTRAMVKIQDGCNHFCTYCIVPYVRGRERNPTPEEILNEIETRLQNGYKEIVITGVKLGAYRSNGTDLRKLLERVLNETGVTRLRLSSVQPADLTPDLLSLWGDTRMCAHIHMPLQSGSYAVLQNMRRPYTPADFERAVSLARQMIPDVSITTDVIVGFPGESPEDFEECYSFCEKMEFAAIHVFPYSARPGTLAAGMKQNISAGEKRIRLQRFLGLAKNTAERFRRRYIGRTMDVLWESEQNNSWQGLTGNYIKVKADSNLNLMNCLGKVKLNGLCQGGMRGELIKS